MLRRIIYWLVNQIRIAKPLHPDHLGVCFTIVALGWVFFVISEKIGIFDPLTIALEDFYTTDVYYEMQHSAEPDLNDDIVIVDMTELTSRDEIAQVITDIKQCKPALMCVDLIFERPSHEPMDDASLVMALEEKGCKQLLSCKLRDYDNDKEAFTNCLYSFTRNISDTNTCWGYTNYYQIRMGGCTRETSLSQQLNDSTVYSLPYMAACLYQGKNWQKEKMNELQIMYEDVDFLTINSRDVKCEAQKLQGKLVILGAMNEEADMHFTPLGKMAGAKVLAYSIHTYLKGERVRNAGILLSLLFAFFAWGFAACMGYWIEQHLSIVFGTVAKVFNFLLGAFLIWITFEVYTHCYVNIDLLYVLLGLAMVEDLRELYATIIKWVAKKTQWKFLKKSLYY